MFSYSPSASLIINFLHLILNVAFEYISQLKFSFRETYIIRFDKQFAPIFNLFDLVNTSPWNLCSTKLFSISLQSNTFGLPSALQMFYFKKLQKFVVATSTLKFRSLFPTLKIWLRYSKSRYYFKQLWITSKILQISKYFEFLNQIWNKKEAFNDFLFD